MGIYRYGDLVRALYQIEDKILTEFVSGQTFIGEDEKEPSYALYEQMEVIRNLTKDYNYEQEFKPRRKRQNKRRGAF